MEVSFVGQIVQVEKDEYENQAHTHSCKLISEGKVSKVMLHTVYLLR